MKVVTLRDVSYVVRFFNVLFYVLIYVLFYVLTYVLFFVFIALNTVYKCCYICINTVKLRKKVIILCSFCVN